MTESTTSAEDEISLKELIIKLKAITKEKFDTRIFIRADQQLSYGQIMHIMSQISNAGFVQVGLVSQTIQSK